MPELSQSARLRGDGESPENRGADPVYELSQDGHPSFRETAPELSGGEKQLYFLPRPPRIEPTGNSLGDRPFPSGEKDVQSMPSGPGFPGRAQGQASRLRIV